PVAPQSLDGLFRLAAERSGNDDLAFLADVLGRLPTAPVSDRVAAARRSRDTDVARRQFARLLDERPNLVAVIDTIVDEINHRADDLDVILDRQHYRLAHWRAARRDLGYRRFFGINTLAGLGVEDELVFHDTHRLVLRMAREGIIGGLRVDHPDGLRDPLEYLGRLREQAPDCWIVVEKILERDEGLPDDWPCDGTTGYDFLAA